MKILVFIFLLFSSAMTAQSTEKWIRDSIRKESQRRQDETLRVKILSGLKDADLPALSEKIVSGIDFTRLQHKNLVFHFRNLCNDRRGPLMFEEDICWVNTVNPAYHHADFWTSRTIRLIQEKYHKNLIPGLKRADGLITDSEEFNHTAAAYYAGDSRKIIDLAKTKKRGKVIDKIAGQNTGYKAVVQKESTFYYFPYRNKKLMLTRLNGRIMVCGSIFLQFANFPDGIVTVKTDYMDGNDAVYTSYQFKDRKWTEIPAKQEDQLKFNF